MSSEGLRRRAGGQAASADKATAHDLDTDPALSLKHGPVMQGLLMLAFATYMNLSCLAIHIDQWMLAPLYFVSRPYYYAWMAFTKQLFGLVSTTITCWFSPTVIRISGEDEAADQLRIDANGKLEASFPERLVLIANHQIYNDWLYLWWISYTNRMHGHIYIILKESLKYIPFIGPGMMFYGFIFLARNWAKDQARFRYRLQKLKTAHDGPMTGANRLNPMWLLIFPEGTNLSKNGRANSAKWAAKSGQQDMRHVLLPRSTGLHFCLQELRGTVEWVYDCTIAYEGVPPGQYGQDIFTLRSMYFQGRAPKSVNLHWRRFAVSSIPEDSDEFAKWVHARWTEKDEMLEQFAQTGRLPPNSSKKAKAPYIETQVEQRRPYEFLIMYVPAAVLGLLWLFFFRLLR